MNNSITKSFLQPDISRIRKSIVDIDDSYNNDWDIVAELCQNAVDAIKKSDCEEGLIRLFVNSLDGKIEIEDNGVGISPSDLPVLLAPFSTNKHDDTDSVGEKGVGLTFVLFSCNKFKIDSSDGHSASVAILNDAYLWKKGHSEEDLELEINDYSKGSQGTKIELADINKDLPIFSLSFSQLVFVLRTRTALGDTNLIWGNEEKSIRIELNFIDRNGNKNQANFMAGYWLPFEGLNKNSLISLDEFKSYASLPGRTDQEKRRLVQDKIIHTKGVKEYNGREIKYVSCFLPSRSVWNELTERHGLASPEQLKDQEWLDNFYYTKFESGIFTSVKGMPTGISITPPNTAFSGYWPNIFILFEDRSLQFDIGRKSIHGMTSKKYKGFAREIFNDYVKTVTKYISGNIGDQDTEFDKEEIFAEIDTLIDLNNKNTRFIKSPKDQEASVAAIFYELIGKGIINEIEPLISGYRNKYDLYAKWGHKKLVIEFKSKISNILKDFNDEQKLFDEVNIVVCWNPTEQDEQLFKSKGISLKEIEQSDLAIGAKKYPPHVTHILHLGNVNPVYIIDLKKLIQE